jgi:hypothetical protein
MMSALFVTSIANHEDVLATTEQTTKPFAQSTTCDWSFNRASRRLDPVAQTGYRQEQLSRGPTSESVSSRRYPPNLEERR